MAQLKVIIRSRIEEIMESIKNSLIKNNINPYIFNNIVLTGGCSSINGIDKITSRIFKKNVRIGSPINIENLPQELKDPTFCGATGMLIFLSNSYLRQNLKDGFEPRTNWFKRFLERLISI